MVSVFRIPVSRLSYRSQVSFPQHSYWHSYRGGKIVRNTDLWSWPLELWMFALYCKTWRVRPKVTEVNSKQEWSCMGIWTEQLKSAIKPTYQINICMYVYSDCLYCTYSYLVTNWTTEINAVRIVEIFSTEASSTALGFWLETLTNCKVFWLKLQIQSSGCFRQYLKF